MHNFSDKFQLKILVMLMLALEIESCSLKFFIVKETPRPIQKVSCDYCVLCQGSQGLSDADDEVQIPVSHLRKSETPLDQLPNLHGPHVGHIGLRKAYDYAGYICFWKRAPNQTRERIGCGLKTFHGLSRLNTGNYANWIGLRELRVKNCTQMKCVDTVHCLDGLNPN